MLFPLICWESELVVWETKRKLLENPGSPEQGNVVGLWRRQVIWAFCGIFNPSLESSSLHSSLARGCPRWADGRPSLSIASWTSHSHSWLFSVDLRTQTQVLIRYLALFALEHSKGFSVSRISHSLLKAFSCLSALSTPLGTHHTSPPASGPVRRPEWLLSSPIISERRSCAFSEWDAVIQ